jgi:hypothetical protein
MDMLHHGGRSVKRLVIENKNNLAITPLDDEVYALTGFNLKDSTIIGEVEVPDELVEVALAFANIKTKLDSLRGSFQKLLR